MLPHVEESSCRRALRGVRVSVTSGYCQSICARTHWEAGTITGQASIESDVRHRARQNLEIVWGAGTSTTDSFALRPYCYRHERRRGSRKFVRCLEWEGEGETADRAVARSRLGGKLVCPAVRLRERSGAINRTGLRTGRGRLGAPSDPEQQFQLIPRQRGFRLAGT